MTIHWALVPRDGLFLKDARGWFTSASGRARSLDWPTPPTLLGALRTAYGRSLEADLRRPLRADEWLSETAPLELGATLALRRTLPDGRWERVWPVPADVVYFDQGGQLAPTRLVPRPPSVPTIGLDDDPAREALWTWRPTDDSQRRKPAPRPATWSEGELVAWARDEALPAIAPNEGSRRAPSRRLDVRLSLDEATLTAANGLLYAVEIVEPLVHVLPATTEERAIAVAFESPRPLADGAWLSVGGKSRLVRAEAVDPQIFAPPDLDVGPCDAVRLLVVTPARFERGWLPDGLERRGSLYRGRIPGFEDELVLRAAFVPRPVHVSGWDMAGGPRGRPRPTDRLVAPGAVYVFHKASGRPFEPAELKRAWLASWGARTKEGFGRFLAAAWKVPEALRNPLREGVA